MHVCTTKTKPRNNSLCAELKDLFHVDRSYGWGGGRGDVEREGGKEAWSVKYILSLSPFQNYKITKYFTFRFLLNQYLAYS